MTQAAADQIIRANLDPALIPPKPIQTTVLGTQAAPSFTPTTEETSMAKLDAEARNALPDSAFASIDSKGNRSLPINDAAHVRAAMARFDQTQFESASAKDAARTKILAAAKKYGITTTAFSDLIAARQAADPMIPLSTLDAIIDSILGPDDENEPATATEHRQADDAGDSATPGDVHVDAPLTTRRKSPLLKRLMQGLRARVKTQRYLSAEDVETEYRSALGHAGGTGRVAAEPADAEVCPVCMAAGHGGAPGCMCPACAEGDPADCECQAIMDQDEDEVSPSQASERHFFEVTASGGETLHLFMEQRTFADAPSSINILPKPGLYKSPKYGDISISAERNANFVRNFAAGVYQTRLPIDAEHESKLSGALGWMTAATQNEDGSVDAQIDWTDRGRQMLATDRFKYFSPEWYDVWMDPATENKYTDVLIGGGLTGRPFFKEGSLRPLVASETGLRIGDDPTPIRPLPSTGTNHRPDGQEQKNMTEPTQLTEDEIKRFREMDAELRQAKEEAATATTKAEEAATRASELERENRRRTFAETASTWHGETAGHVDFLEALPTDELRQQYTEQQTAQAVALAEAQKQAALFAAVGVAGHESADSALGKLNAAAETIRASEPTLSVEQARAKAIKGNPQMYAEYEAETAS